MQGDKFSCLALKSCRWTHIYGSTAHFFVCSVVGCKYNLFVPKTRKIVGKYNISVAAAIIFVSYAYFIDMEFFCMNLQFLCSQLYGGRQIAVGCSRSFVAPVDVFSQCVVASEWTCLFGPFINIQAYICVILLSCSACVRAGGAS